MRTEDEGATVWTVIVTACAPALAARFAGENVTVAPVGSPLAVQVTAPGYVVCVGAMLKVKAADLPAVTVCDVASALLNVKSGGAAVALPLRLTVCAA